MSRRVLPGFGLSLSFALSYLTLLVLIPLGACFVKAMNLSWQQFLAAAWSERARAAYQLTFAASLAAALINAVLGLLVAWVLARYEFPFKRLADAFVDLPLALPTAVAGLVYSSLYVPTGWLGQLFIPLRPYGIDPSYSRLAIVIVLVFTGFPFVVRTVQPVLQDLDADIEEAAATLGASRWTTFTRVLLPMLAPAMLTGFALAFARALGEYGSVVFVSSNMPFQTEIAPVLIVMRLEEYRPDGFGYADAAAIAVVLLTISFFMLIVINLLERWSRRHAN